MVSTEVPCSRNVQFSISSTDTIKIAAARWVCIYSYFLPTNKTANTVMWCTSLCGCTRLACVCARLYVWVGGHAPILDPLKQFPLSIHFPSSLHKVNTMSIIIFKWEGEWEKRRDRLFWGIGGDLIYMQQLFRRWATIHNSSGLLTTRELY